MYVLIRSKFVDLVMSTLVKDLPRYTILLESSTPLIWLGGWTHTDPWNGPTISIFGSIEPLSAYTWGS